jgi:hypothetical protein
MNWLVYVVGFSSIFSGFWLGSYLEYQQRRKLLEPYRCVCGHLFNEHSQTEEGICYARQGFGFEGACGCRAFTHVRSVVPKTSSELFTLDD